MPRFHRAILACLSGPDAGVARGPRFSDRAEALASLPTAVGGGAGLTRGDRVAHAAWLGSWGLAWHSMLALHPRLFDGVHLVPPLTSTAASVPSSLFAGIAASFEVVGAAEASILDARSIGVTLPAGAPRPSHAPPVHPQEYAARTHTQLQRAYGRYLHTEDWLRLRDGLTAPRERAWLMSCGFRSLGAQFMTAVPAFRALRMSPAEFSVAVRHHFGERQPVVTGVAVCGCGAAMGERGDGAHYLECRGGRTGNWFARFHDAIERQVARMMGEVYLGRGTVRTQDYTGHRHYSRSHIPDMPGHHSRRL